jgi:threonine synthase
MNVGHPSNMARLVALYGGVMDEKGNILRQPDLQRMRNDFLGVSVTDEETMQTMTSVWKEKGIILNPSDRSRKGAMEYRIKTIPTQRYFPLWDKTKLPPGNIPCRGACSSGKIPLCTRPLKKIVDKDELVELGNQFPAF